MTQSTHSVSKAEAHLYKKGTMHRISSVALSIFVVALVACSNPLAVGEDGVRVQARNSSVQIQNSRSEPVFFLMMERQFAATALWGPCTDPNECPRIEPSQALSVDRAEIGGVESDSEEAILFWWELVPAEDEGFEPDRVRSIVFPLD